MKKEEHKGDPLWDSEAFFKLPVAELGECGVCPLVSRTQPTGFRGVDGHAWRAVGTDDGMKRERIV